MTDEQPPRLAALKYRDFRLLWGGQAFSQVGTYIQLIAVNWHVFLLLRDVDLSLSLFGQSFSLGAEALGLGTLGLVRVLPVLLFTLVGGLAADRFDRRAILIATQVIQMALAGLLGYLALSGQATLWWLYAITAIDAAVGTFDEPSRQAMVPQLVPKEHFGNAVSLNMMLFYLGTIFGPMVAGFMIEALEIGLAYVANSASFLISILSLVLLQYRGQPADSQPAPALQQLREGWQFTRRSDLLWSTAILDFVATLFGSVRTMLPIVASELFGLGAAGYGLLATAQPVGAVVTATVMALRKDVKRQGMVMLVSVVVYGVSTAIFGLTTAFWLAYAVFMFSGVGDMISTIIRGTVRQIVTPDRLRGRVTSVTMLFAFGGPQLGELEAGLVAAVLGVPFAIVSGGILTVVATVYIALRYPRLRDYEATAAQIEAARLQPLAHGKTDDAIPQTPGRGG